MARRKLDVPPPPDLATLAGRIAWLLLHLFGGNLRRMAEAVGLSHSVLSKVIGGRQGAGRRTVEAIAAHPRVNPGWLLHGHGEPLLAARQDALAEGWPVPVSRVILPGPPASHPELLTGASFPLAGTFYRESRYWLQVADDDPIVAEPAEKIAAGDLLLLDADAGYWEADLRVAANRLVALRLGGRGVPRYALARCRLDPTSGTPGFRNYGAEDVPAAAPRPVPFNTERQGRAVERFEDHRDVDPRVVAGSPPPGRRPRQHVRAAMVGVCVLVIRP